ncbi:hypothetical protein ACUOAQ_29795, partial [Escherichia sp. SP-MK]
MCFSETDAVLDEERQTPEQVTITVKINLLPDVV